MNEHSTCTILFAICQEQKKKAPIFNLGPSVTSVFAGIGRAYAGRFPSLPSQCFRVILGGNWICQEQKRRPQFLIWGLLFQVMRASDYARQDQQCPHSAPFGRFHRRADRLRSLLRQVAA